MSYRHPTMGVRWPTLALAVAATLLAALFALILSDAAPTLIDGDASLAAGLWTVSLVTLIRMAARGPTDPLRPLPALLAGGCFLLGLVLLAVAALNSIGV